MRIVVIEAGKDGKITLTKDELQKMLDNAYQEGKAEGSAHPIYWYRYYPYWTNQPWYINTTSETVTNTCPADSVTISASSVNNPSSVSIASSVTL